ncbi:MAG: VanW family protein [Clostridia bacterium]|nr:VanW family protein [Clostridia bacterium]
MKDMKLKTKIIIACVAFVLAAIIACLTALACSNKIYNGVSVSGVNLGGMTVDAAEKFLSNEDFFDKLPAFVCDDREFEIEAEDISLKCDADKTAEIAHAYGRDANIFYRIGNIFNVMFNGEDLPIEISYDEEKLNAIFDEQIGDLRTPSVEPEIRVEGDKLYIKNGSQGLDVNKDKLRADLQLVAAGDENKIELLIETVNPTPISAESLHEQYAKEVVEAAHSISNMRITYTESENGIDFDIAEAEKIITDNLKNSHEYAIPLTITEPEMTTEELDKSLFGDCLGTYTTRYNAGEVGRTKNVTLAARAINNIVLEKGQVFSYNGIVGERSTARGYAGAKVYANGEVVEGLGGGICQVSSTLYNAVLYADLEIVSRTCHSLPVAYVPLGRDATVAYGSIDFKFKNQYDSPVKVLSSVGGGVLTISIYGKKTSDKKVEISTQYVSSTPFTTIEQPDETIAEGITKVKQTGSNGAVVNTYKKVTENGKVISNKMIHTSRYSPINKIVHVPPVPETPVEEVPPAEIPETVEPAPEVTDPTAGYPVATPPEQQSPTEEEHPPVAEEVIGEEITENQPSEIE